MTFLICINLLGGGGREAAKGGLGVRVGGEGKNKKIYDSKSAPNGIVRSTPDPDWGGGGRRRGLEEGGSIYIGGAYIRNATNGCNEDDLVL
ncbi:hypothetical protein GWI33_011660 [Rhynchophorus ferrugineus]|uniref:Uncharacterized protein n=1 Tax=Rhynchophorus ferrugineus TaxID=354439 RepID=A0A834I9X1_RHYFE|nr:hypothetical protein GWI33_011660 [Rhynchophorus ferrugineus]